MSTKCGLTYTLSCLLFLKLGRGPGGALKLGVGGARWGRGSPNVCFQYEANHGLLSVRYNFILGGCI